MTEPGIEMLRKLLGEERAAEVRGVVQAFARLRSSRYELPRRRNMVAAQPRSQDPQPDYGRGARGAGPRERAAPEHRNGPQQRRLEERDSRNPSANGPLRRVSRLLGRARHRRRSLQAKTVEMFRCSGELCSPFSYAQPDRRSLPGQASTAARVQRPFCAAAPAGGSNS